MLVVTTIAAVRSRRGELSRLGRRVALVPTMGALHQGHLSLVAAARERADEAWASVFVNPAQFCPGEDLDRYPRDLERDRELLEAAGAALLFAPSAREIYPRPPMATVDLPDFARHLCGAHRPGHFRGVALVVAKLLDIVQPEVAVFGAKDWQQAALIRALVAELVIPTEVVTAPTVREVDGLAMSSRNAYLTVEQRRAATVLYRALRAGADAARAGESRGAELERLLAAEISREPLARLQYVAAVDPVTLAPLPEVRGTVLLALAVTVGATRLIDNLLVEGL
jgi:pantoate--beta-alanine ligase